MPCRLAAATARAPPWPSSVVPPTVHLPRPAPPSPRSTLPGGVSGRHPWRMTSTYPVWGWGRPEEAPTTAELEALAPVVRALLGFPLQAPERPARPADLPAPRVRVPASLAAIGASEPLDRARHALGRSYRDVLRGLRAQIDHPPDVVLRPRTEAEVTQALEWCAGAGVAVVPFGGGTSVVGGVEPAVGEGFAGVVSLDLEALAGVAEVDRVSRAALVLAGTTGPDLEAGLKGHGLTLRFYPQSFERSTIGGWLATRAAGHFSTRATHVDDLVESIRMVTPAGLWASRRLPGSGAGPSPDRLALGSEGILGVVTEAWLRVRPRPARRAAVRGLLHAGIEPATCRLVDAAEAALTGTLATGEAPLVLGFESARLPVDAELAAALEVCADAGGRALDADAG